MHAAAQEFLSLPNDQRRAVHIRLCELALRVWEQYVLAEGRLRYRESVAGTLQEIDAGLPREALVSIRTGRDLSHVEARYRESIVALQDDDLELPDPVQFAYYAIYNSFERYVLGTSTDDWLIVNQALSSSSESDVIKVLEEAIASVRER